jgi:hypothetical protein
VRDTDCAPGSLCLQSDATGKRECYAPCDRFVAGSCPMGQDCSGFAADVAGRVIPYCAVAGTIPEDAPCVVNTTSPAEACAPGLSCARRPSGATPNPSDPTVCERRCDTTHACPQTAQSCVTLSVKSVVTPYSVCWPPMGACTPNPCTESNKNVCSVLAGAAHCACNDGYVDDGGACIKPCTSTCGVKTCGPDGCGGTCGDCGVGSACTSAGQCCARDCAGKTCGPDGCGGTCGTCAKGELCGATGQCSVCTPSCVGKECGSDGCGGVCGFCSAGTCASDGHCACTPRCAGKNCGDDGCGGECGTCTGGKACGIGLCTDPNFCSGAPCYGGAAEGGCCASSSFCVRGSGQPNTYCRSKCGASGEGCRGDGDCCNPLSCFAGVCQ